MREWLLCAFLTGSALVMAGLWGRTRWLTQEVTQLRTDLAVLAEDVYANEERHDPDCLCLGCVDFRAIVHANGFKHHLNGGQ